MFSIPGYNICEKLYEHNGIVQYNAIRESDNVAVTLRVPKNSSAQANQIAWLDCDYTLTKQLKTRGTLKALTRENTKDIPISVFQVGFSVA